MTKKARKHTRRSRRRYCTEADKPKGKYCNGKLTVFGKKVNWYWDVRLWSPLIIILLIIALNINMKGEVEPVPIEEPALEVVEPTTEPTEETVPEPTISPEESDIIALARLADTVGKGKSDEVKTIIMWIAINRSEDRANGYGDSLQEEIAKPKQWQQYDPEGVYLDHTYQIAKEVYNIWKSNGPRPLYKDMLWFAFESDGTITARNKFKDTKGRSEANFG